MATAEVRDDGETTELENPPAYLKSVCVCVGVVTFCLSCELCEQ